MRVIWRRVNYTKKCDHFKLATSNHFTSCFCLANNLNKYIYMNIYEHTHAHTQKSYTNKDGPRDFFFVVAGCNFLSSLFSFIVCFGADVWYIPHKKLTGLFRSCHSIYTHAHTTRNGQFDFDQHKIGQFQIKFIAL